MLCTTYELFILLRGKIAMLQRNANNKQNLKLTTQLIRFCSGNCSLTH